MATRQMKKDAPQQAEPVGFELSLKVLAESTSVRAPDTLREAMTGASPYVQERIFDILRSRVWDRVAPAMISQYHRLVPGVRAKILDNTDTLAPHLKNALVNDSGEAKSNALSIISDSRRAALLPLITILLRGIDERYSERAVKVLTQTVERLQQVIRKFGGKETEERPCSIKKATGITLAVLAEALRTFPAHRQNKVLENLLNFGEKGHETLLNGLSQEQSKAVTAVTEILLNRVRPETDAFVARMLCSEKFYVYKKGEYIFRQRSAASMGRVVCSALKYADVDKMEQLEQNFGRGPWWKIVLQNVKYLDAPAQEVLVAWLEKRFVPPSETQGLLKSLIESSLPDVRRRALALLDNRGKDNRAAYAGLLRDPDERIQLRATTEVIGSDLPEREELIVRQLLSDFSSVREAASREVAVFSFRSYFDAFDRLDEKTRQRASGAIAKIDTRLTGKLREALSKKSEQTRVKALNMIRLTGKGRELGEEIINMVNSSISAVKVAAVAALCAVNSPQARDTARSCLDDPDRRVVANAVECLAEMRCSDALEDVIQLRTHSGPLVRASVVLYLHAIGDAAHKDVLLQMLNDPADEIRVQAVRVVARLSPPDAVEMLRSVERCDQSADVRAAAREALHGTDRSSGEKSDLPNREGQS